MLAYYIHDLTPLIFRIYDNVGPRWYGLAYVLAFLASYLLFRWLARNGYADLPDSKVGDFILGNSPKDAPPPQPPASSEPSKTPDRRPKLPGRYRLPRQEINSC